MNRKKSPLIMAILCIWMAYACTSPADNIPQIIFDTDFGGDADDLGALAMLHHLHEKQECNLMAIMCWSAEESAVSGIDAVNRFYMHPEIPIGTIPDTTTYTDWHYSKPIKEAFPYELDQNKVVDACILYRKLLAESADKSITIVVVGPLKNIKDLIDSEGDSISGLTGKELIAQKVKEIVIMGGRYPGGESEWNFYGRMPGVTKYVIGNLNKVDLTFSVAELGTKIQTGEAFNEEDPHSPLYVGFLFFSKHAPWLKENPEGIILDNSSYDQSAVLYAVRGTQDYFEKIPGERCVPDDSGGNKWIKDANSNHAYLKLAMDKEEIAAQVEALMLGRF